MHVVWTSVTYHKETAALKPIGLASHREVKGSVQPYRSVFISGKCRYTFHRMLEIRHTHKHYKRLFAVEQLIMAINKPSKGIVMSVGSGWVAAGVV